MNSPESVFKYLPRKYAEELLSGRLFLRNLAYFKRLEHAERGDLAEGMHIDRPDNLVSITAVDGSFRTEGHFAFHNEVDHQRVFAFCMALVLEPRLFEAFEADCCIEIVDVPELIRRTKLAVRRSPTLAKAGLLHGPVRYYHSNQAIDIDIKEPKNLPFLKPFEFEGQSEYRLVCAEKRGLTLTQSVVTAEHSIAAEASAMQERHRILPIGSIRDITRAHNP